MLLLAAALFMSSLGDFTLQSGRVIQDCHLGYRTYGEMNSDKSNVILFPTWFNGTTADLEKYIGLNGLVSDNRFFVITVDAFANGVSSSPSNSTLQHGQAFPRVTIADMVEAEHKLLTEKMGIHHVYAVMGISMGGMQTFQWLTSYPDFMDRAVSIVGTPRTGEKDAILWSSFLEGLHPNGADAGTADRSAKSTEQAMLALAIANAPEILDKLLNPQTRQQLGQVLEGGNQPGHTPPPPTTQDGAGNPKMPIDIPVGKNPEDVLHQFGAVVVHDISRPYGYSWTRTAAAIKAKCLVINSEQDKLVSPEFPQEFATEIQAQKLMVHGACGHNAFKPDCEESAMISVIRQFLEQ